MGCLQDLRIALESSSISSLGDRLTLNLFHAFYLSNEEVFVCRLSITAISLCAPPPEVGHKLVPFKICVDSSQLQSYLSQKRWRLGCNSYDLQLYTWFNPWFNSSKFRSKFNFSKALYRTGFLAHCQSKIKVSRHRSWCATHMKDRIRTFENQWLFIEFLLQGFPFHK